tara:strand:- start:257 stop:415 length:159 start_codon:yes stop_codon:yes gene_type:complete
LPKGRFEDYFQASKNQKQEPEIQAENNPVGRRLSAIAEMVEVSLEQNLHEKP